MREGLYEKVISNRLNDKLNDEISKIKETGKIDDAEASRVLSEYVAEVIEEKLGFLDDKNAKIEEKVAFVNEIINKLPDDGDIINNEISIHNPPEQLLALVDKNGRFTNIEGKSKIERPQTSIAKSSLFTGSKNEPSMFSELNREINSSNRIDILVSFIKWNGLRLILDSLRDFTRNGGKLRVITTSYMGATDIKAVDELSKLQNTEVKVSYDTKRTRLHAKSYIFYRETGFTTAYIGSSNISNLALTNGLEWNIKITKKDQKETMAKIEASFESYWFSSDFKRYTEKDKEELTNALKTEKYHKKTDKNIYTLDVHPYAYQQKILDKIQAEREIRGRYKNLVVAATGTGKTVVAAFDYRRFLEENKGKRCRLLFVAHRKEILEQSLYTFRAVLKDPNFGDLLYGGHVPESKDCLFATIQSFNSKKLYENTSKDYYDYIVVDEFHHAVADSYDSLLEYYNPKILLGLTATPERMDGKSILKYFDNRIAAEIRLPEAINKQLLVPFQYFGVTDNVDLNDLKWTRGGYDIHELSKVYYIDEERAKKRVELIVDACRKYIADIDDVKGLGFCVSIGHAKFMSNEFNKYGIPAMYLTSDSKQDERNTAKSKLEDGEIKFIFVVDLYNEGVDIPAVNTVMFLRPTESLTVFLQQLGRGLRLFKDKDCLTVLDFVGNANKNYNFEEKFEALLNDGHDSVEDEMKKDFVSLPNGCFIKLEKKAKEYIFNNIRQSLKNKRGIINKIAMFRDNFEGEVNLANFLKYNNLNIKYIYKMNNMSFSRLCVEAGVLDDFDEYIENMMSKAFKRIVYMNSKSFIEFILKVLKNEKADDFSFKEERMLDMFDYTIWQNNPHENGFASSYERIMTIKDAPIMLKELIAILEYNYNEIDFMECDLNAGFDIPIKLYANYTRDQILKAFDLDNPSSVREGVKYLKDENVELLFVTLNKSEKDYSPTTLYKDYSVSDQLFHWQSQNATSETSKVGDRYINHKKYGTRILLFVREYNNDKVLKKAAPYTCLGTVNYVKHDGNKPMNILWKLDNKIPARFINTTNKLVME